MIYYYRATYFPKGALFLGWSTFFILFVLMLIDTSWLNAWEARMCQKSLEHYGGLALANSRMPSQLSHLPLVGQGE